MVKLDTMNKKATENTCHHMNSQNDCWMMQLKAIEEEYYSIGNLKSYSWTMYIFCISLHCDVLDTNGL